MTKTHQMILDKIKKYPVDVQALAVRALELSESLPETSVSEQLKGVVRQIVKEKEKSK